MRRWGGLLFLVLLSACQTRPIAPEKLAQVKSIGVLSTLGDKIAVQRIGFMVFSNSEDSFTAPQADLDGFVAQRIIAASAGRYEARRVALDPAAPDRADLVVPAPIDSWSRFMAALRRQVASQPPADAWVVVTPARSQFGSTNQSVKGVGLLRASSLEFYAAYAVTVVSGSDFSVLGTAFATMDRTGFNSMTPRRYVVRRADPKLWSDSAPSLGPEQREAIADGIRQLLAESLPEVLNTVGIVP